MTDAVKQYFLDTVSKFMGTVSLSYLNRLETKIAKHFRFTEFSQLHQGSFFEFLVKNMQVFPEHHSKYKSFAFGETRCSAMSCNDEARSVFVYRFYRMLQAALWLLATRKFERTASDPASKMCMSLLSNVEKPILQT